jgi:hypothetical protein
MPARHFISQPRYFSIFLLRTLHLHATCTPNVPSGPHTLTQEINLLQVLTISMEEIVAASNQFQAPQPPKLDSPLQNPSSPDVSHAGAHEGRELSTDIALQHQTTTADTYQSADGEGFGPGTAAVELDGNLELPQTVGAAEPSPNGALTTEIRMIVVMQR